MKKMLSIFSIVFVLSLLVSIPVSASGCNESRDSGKIVVGFSQVGAEGAWRVANTLSIKGEAEKRPNIALIFSDAEGQQENQIQAIRNFIAEEVDVIAFSPIVVSGYGPVLEEAKEAGIPVILLDRGLDLQDDSLWVSLMGSDFRLEGERAAKWIVENYPKIKREDKSLDKINVVELQGAVGADPANERAEGWRKIMADHPEYEIIRTQTGEWGIAKGKEVMEAFLKAEGDKIDIVYAHNDDMALGAIQAIEEFGLDAGKDIILISVDATKGAFEAMIDGDLNCTVECSPLLGPQLYDAVEALVKGETIPKRIITEETIFPMEVAEEILPTRIY